MSFQKPIEVANPSRDEERSDYIEVELGHLGVPRELDESNLRLFRIWNSSRHEEIPYQIDYPFGKTGGYRILTFFAAATPPDPSGRDDYGTATAFFLLEEGKSRVTTKCSDLWVEHYSSRDVFTRQWQPDQDQVGVKLANGSLEAYFSLVPRPLYNSPVNYAGSATSIVHCRARKSDPDRRGNPLSPYEQPPGEAFARWGQLTHIDLYPTPWSRRSYQAESLLGERGNEPHYTLAWSNSGPMRSVVCMKSKPLICRYEGKPFFQPDAIELTCHLYRMISFFPKEEWYAEQLFVRPEVGAVDIQQPRVSLSFRAHYFSYVDYPEGVDIKLARLEHIPDYFCVWRYFARHHRGYGFCSDSHVRAMRTNVNVPDTPVPEIRWRLQLGHEHRCVHMFPFHGFPEAHGNPEGEVDWLSEVGKRWYQCLFKPLRSIPLNRYLQK